MPVAAADMKLYLSGGSGNADPNASFGGPISATEVNMTTVLNNLFADVAEAEAIAGSNKYRCVYLKNVHATDTLNAIKVYLSSNTPSPSTNIQIGIPAAAGNVTAVANEDTAPSGITFSNAPDAGSALSIGNLTAGSYYAIWFKRVVTAGAAAATSDPFQLKMTGTPV